MNKDYIHYYLTILESVKNKVDSSADPVDLVDGIYRYVALNDTVPMDSATDLSLWVSDMIAPHPNLYHWLKSIYKVEIDDALYRRINKEWIESMIKYLESVNPFLD